MNGPESSTPGCCQGGGEWASGVVSSSYWSSTTNSVECTLAWAAGLGSGSVDDDLKTNLWYVWPVRGGQ
jgi:hypothetical protein